MEAHAAKLLARRACSKPPKRFQHSQACNIHAVSAAHLQSLYCKKQQAKSHGIAAIESCTRYNSTFRLFSTYRLSRDQISGSRRSSPVPGQFQQRYTRPCTPYTQVYQQIQFLSNTAQVRSQDSGNTSVRNESKIVPPTTTTPVPTVLAKISPLALKEQKENIYTLPNLLTFSRLLVTPVIGYSILTAHPHLALGLFAYAGITDLIDGYLARRFGSQTVLGTIIDPMADKTLMTTVVVCLTIQGLIPTWLAVVILGRDVALAISAIYFRWISLPPPKTFMRYWDFSLPSAEVHPTEISKINTFLQLLLVGNAMVLPTLPHTVIDLWNLHGVFEGWQYLVAGTTVWSGLSYVFNKDAVKILSEQEAKEKEAEAKKKLESR